MIKKFYIALRSKRSGTIKYVSCDCLTMTIDQVGDILTNHYNDLETVKKLVSNGDLHSLGKTISECDLYKDTQDWILVRPKLIRCERVIDIPSYIQYIYMCFNQLNTSQQIIISGLYYL